MKVTFELAHRGQEVYLEHLAPEEIIHRIGGEGICTIAAVRQDNDGNRMAEGLMMFAVNAKRERRLTWLFVDPLYRGKGIGSDLLEIFVSFPSDEEADALCSDLLRGDMSAYQVTEFLLKRGFSNTMILPGVYYIDGKALMESEVLSMIKQSNRDFKGIESFEMYSKEEMISGLHELGVSWKTVAPLADGKASMFRVIKGKARGVIAVTCSERGYRIFLLKAKKNSEKILLLEALYLWLSKRMKKTELLIVDSNVSDVENLVERFFGKKQRSQVLRVIL